MGLRPASALMVYSGHPLSSVCDLVTLQHGVSIALLSKVMNGYIRKQVAAIYIYFQHIDYLAYLL